MSNRHEPENPLRRLDDWEDFVEARYPETGGKPREDYRNYDNPARDTVREFYRLNHRHQTYDFVREKKRQFLRLDRRPMTVLEALDFLDTLVDDSDPDISLSQREHLLQTAEAIRGDGHEDWFVLTGLIHDLGKVLCLFGEPQWAVVGDTFPVGCAFSDRIVYPEFFADNPFMPGTGKGNTGTCSTSTTAACWAGCRSSIRTTCIRRARSARNGRSYGRITRQ
jgi:inositol oxygenase